MRIGARMAALALAGSLAFAAPAADARTATFGPLPPPNPGTGPNGIATMHGDSASSDSTPFAGPGTDPIEAHRIPLASACPTVLNGQDGMPVALCTTILGRTPTVHLLDPASGDPVAELALAKGSLLGGVYAYLDGDDRLVVVDGENDLLRIGHDRDQEGKWRLFVAQRTPLAAAVTGHCGKAGCDSVVALTPDWQRRIWFATAAGVVGLVDPASGQARTLALTAGDRVDNSISSAPQGTAVATDHALYLLTAGQDGMPRVSWRQPYDRGPARKPGQLSWGTGATPTFFGPRTGTEYLTVTDNAVPRENLLVYRASTGQAICSVPVLGEHNSGTENSPIGSGRSVFVASTYGYPYPATPEGAGPSSPANAPFAGGMQRIDVRDDETGCDPVWTNDVRSAAVPRLSLGDGLLYTVERGGNLLSHYDYTAIDPDTGQVRSAQRIGATFVQDTLQMVGTITPEHVLYQGTTTGIVRISGRRQLFPGTASDFVVARTGSSVYPRSTRVPRRVGRPASAT